MNIAFIHASSTRPLFRALSVALCLSLAYSATAPGINPLMVEAVQHIQDMGRKPVGHHTDRPTKVFKGANPGRDPVGRGGVWTPKLLNDLKKARQQEKLDAPWSERDLLLSMTPIPALLGTSMLQEGGEGGGGDLPGEGGGPGGGGEPGGGEEPGSGTGGGHLNTNTGNRHVMYPIVSWNAPGQNGVSFNLHHNSRGAYSYDLGKGWSHSYDVKIAHTSGSAIVRYGDGLEVPFTEPTTNTFVAPAGHYETLTRNATTGVWTLTTKSKWVMTFIPGGRLSTVTDRNGNTTTIYRNGSAKITSIEDSYGRALDFTYGTNGLISEVEDPAGRHWYFDYDSNNDMLSIGYPQLNEQEIVYYRYFTYDSASNILTETDRRGKVWTFTYNSSENLTSFTNPLSQTYTYTYGSASVTLTKPNSKTVVYNYSSGLVASVVDEASYSDAYVYDSNKNVTQYTDRRGKVWTATYDSSGNTLTLTNPLSKTWTYTYNSFNKVLTATDPNSNVTTNTYDSNGNLLTTVDGLSRTVATITYNGDGDPITVTDALSRVSYLYYNSQGDVTQTVAPGSINSYATFDILGRVTSSTDAAANTTDITYDGWGRVIEIEEPGNAVSQIFYDLENNIIGAEDPLGRSGSRVINDTGLVTSATNANSETTNYSYNSVGELTSITNGRGYTRTYTYTDRGQVATLTLPDSSVETWAYDGEGNTTAYTNPLSQTILYTYDDAGQQTGVDYPSGLTDTAFSYDNGGRVTSMVDVSGTSSWTYNAANEITDLDTPQGDIDYTYNLAGQILTMVDVGVGTTTTTYDSAGRPSTTTDAFSDVSSYTYDGAGRLSRKDNPNGTYELYSYDSRNRVTSIVTKDSSNATLQSRVYTFDLASQVTQVVEGGVTTDYDYDDIGQLIEETKSTGYAAAYTYDANGNRLTRTVNSVTESYTYDNADKLTAITGGSDARTFTYDAAGRTTGIVRGSGTTAFSYDYESRVTSITKPGMTTNTFTYNGLDTRVGMTDSGGSKTFKRSGVGVTAPVLSDGTANFTPSGEKRGSTKTTFHSALKNSDIQTNSSGAISASKQYDAFGNNISSSGFWKSQFGYAGGFGYQQDSDTGLNLLGHRYYDRDTGRFLTRDVAKDGGNWYSYCSNNPISYFDAEGLKKQVIILIGDLSGPVKKDAGTSLEALVTAYEDAGYEVIVKSVRNEDELVEALSEYDEVVLFGHGSPFVYAGNGGVCNIERTTRRVMNNRIRAGKGRMKRLILWVCDGANKEDRELWFRITERLWGTEDTCFFPRGGKARRGLFSGGKWYNDSKPGYIDNVKKWGGGASRSEPANMITF
ncbi:MAG: RHS repeat protein [Fimbriimonadaceae bacterium]|nr:RHS repeat protein [Fimbriimonadaceae bacterium]